MHLTGIIAEFNPLHSGHKFLIDSAKKYGAVAAVISGNFVQRGDTAIIEKRQRTKMALQSGVDLVLELPVCYSLSTAQNFAFGGVSVLDAVGCNSLVFGSESGEITELKTASEILNSKEFSQKLNKNLQNGTTFAAAREKTATECGLKSGILDKPNNNLAVEYITAMGKIQSKMDCKTVARQGAMHDSDEVVDGFVSASLLREKLKNGDYAFCRNFISEENLKILKYENLSDIKNIENVILGILRTKSLEDFKTLPDLSEGVENKLLRAIKTATTLGELYDSLKVKRYTHARIRRLVLSAVLGLDNPLFMQKPPYIRVLGFNKTGEQVLKENIKKSPIPIVLRAKEIENLSLSANNLFKTEVLATDLYMLSLNKPLECGYEYKANLIKG